jgi:hypothetical protein
MYLIENARFMVELSPNSQVRFPGARVYARRGYRLAARQSLFIRICIASSRVVASKTSPPPATIARCNQISADASALGKFASLVE